MPAPTGYQQAFVRLRSTTGDWLAHPDLRGSLVRDAVNNETNLTDFAIWILGSKYGVPVEKGAGRKTDPKLDEDVLNMRLPHMLAVAIKASASRAGRPWLDEIRATLCTHYGLRVPPKPRQLRRPRRATA